ncbi:MAG TPA: LysM peptidoglycan-binding domain-containing protein [Spirochaetota bacterium]|nr:LysM peptidoglycan-binding domain-containing protein [Spirochaetota bacterium]HOM39041.1 LysM peptidoglycan-binding domain-containing protein [Spirochaetota bacterium]HPQ49906.1 LysM peptidoglycan-binding domain-containing protein [Spirochaetota bacterium]
MRLLSVFLSFFIFSNFLSAYPGLDELLDKRDNKEKIIDHYINELSENISKTNDIIEIKEYDDDKASFDPNSFSINFTMNEQIDFFVKYYTGIGRPSLLLALKRMEIYYPTILEILKRYNMPLDLIALPIIESLYNPSAVSPKGARGIWQLMPITAKMNGLIMNSYIDERSDIYKSTIAAMDYIKSLREMFNDNWDLIIAGYNGGGGYILSQVRKQNTLDFWEMCNANDFKGETLEFVPRFYAVLHILKNLDNYGIEKPNLSEIPNYQIVKSNKTISIAEFAKIIRLPSELIEELNPHFLNGFIFKDSNIYVPYGLKDEVVKNIKLNNSFAKNYSVYENKNTSYGKNRQKNNNRAERKYFLYTVKKGDTLYRISRKYNIDFKVIIKSNNIKDPYNIKPGFKIIIPFTTYTNQPKIDKYIVKRHVVKKGETLFRISKNYGINITRLMNLNNLKDYNIKEGQIIKIPFDES